MREIYSIRDPASHQRALTEIEAFDDHESAPGSDDAL